MIKYFYKIIIAKQDSSCDKKSTYKTQYYRNGLRHREDGPAVEIDDSHKEWFYNGRYHRESGPAIECSDCGSRWYIHGEQNVNDGIYYK